MTKHKADVYTFHARGEYATFLLFEQPRKDEPNTGYFVLAIESSFGGFAYAWSHLGCGFSEFLCGLEADYVGKKMCQGDKREFDAEKTTRAVKEHILEKRKRWLGFTAEQAREAWNSTRFDDELDFIRWHDSDDSDWCQDKHELAVYGPGQRYRAFRRLYELFWPLLCEALKQEKAA